MRIVVLEGSPNKKGSSNLLAGEFIRGAKEAGHTVEVIDAAHADLHPCIGCVRCGNKMTSLHIAAIMILQSADVPSNQEFELISE